MAETRKTSWLRDNGLTLVLLALFIASIAGQLFSGLAFENEQRMEEGAAALAAFPAYVGSGAFLSSVFENWESEFLQIVGVRHATAYFYQRGAAESRRVLNSVGSAIRRAGILRNTRTCARTADGTCGTPSRTSRR